PPGRGHDRGIHRTAVQRRGLHAGAAHVAAGALALRTHRRHVARVRGVRSGRAGLPRSRRRRCGPADPVSTRKSQPIPPAEWVVAAVGLILTLGLLGFLLRSALDGPRRPPDISVAVDSVVQQNSGWLAFVTATNAGDATAADVTLEGAIDGGSQPGS